MLFGLCVLNLLVRVVHVQRVERAAQAAFAAGYWGYFEHWNPVAVMWGPFLLLVSSLGLLVNRWWSLLFSLVISARVVYLSGYLPWLSVHSAHDVPMFSWQAMEKLWLAVYQPHPQYLFEVIVGGFIFVYGMSLCISRRKLHRDERRVWN